MKATPKSALLVIAGKPHDDKEADDKPADDGEDDNTDAHYEQMEKSAYSDFVDAVKSGDDEAGMMALRQFVSICAMHGGEEEGESEADEEAESA